MQHPLIEREQQVFVNTYRRLPVVIKKAQGVRITDAQGKSYLDFLAGIAVNALGHGHPSILKAVKGQISSYMHVSNYFYQEPQIRMAELLVQYSSGDKVFLTNSGTESADGALKLARRWGSEHGKSEVIAFTGGFHGRTYGALSMMDKPLYKDGMGPFLDGTKILPYNDSEQLRKNVSPTTAAVFFEPIQGEGGISMLTPEFVATIQQLAKEYNFLIGADEVQCGVGRTGKMFGYEHWGLQPDIIMSAKGVGGGLPLGAIIAKDHVAAAWGKGMHGTTYGGNPVACAAGIAVMEELEKGLLEHVQKVGTYFGEKLMLLQEDFPALVREIRGKGLMRGIVLSIAAGTMVERLLELGLIVNVTAEKVIRLVPPLIITNSDVDECISIIRKAFSEWVEQQQTA